ncbi:MAG: prenyltransferase, partial [Spirochaetota bacterium]
MTALGRWFRSLRPYSFPASLMPTLLGIAVAIHTGADIDWWTLPLYALSALLFHAGTNVLNDYYDYLHGVDVPGDPDPTHVITQGLVKPRFMLVSGNLYFFLGVVFGSIS